MDRSPAPAGNQMIPQALTPAYTPTAAVSNLQYFILYRKGFYTGYVYNASSDYHNRNGQFTPFRH